MTNDNTAPISDESDESLAIYKELFEEHLTGKDVKAIAKELDVNPTTVYRYLNIEPKQISANIQANEVFKIAKRILVERCVLVLNELDSNKLS